MYYITSDTHFGHGNIIKYCHRPFLAEIDKEEFVRRGNSWHNGDWKGEKSSKWRLSPESIKMMDDHLIDQINKQVQEQDVLWVLGDWCFAKKDVYYEVARSYRERIRCQTVNLIYGNHDHGKIGDLFNEAYHMYNLRVNNNLFVLCHYAMAVWDGSHRGSICLYGHSHSEAESNLEKMMPGRRAMDVGVDNAAKILGEYRPFSINEILQHINNKPGFAFDHHVGTMANTPKEEDLI